MPSSSPSPAPAANTTGTPGPASGTARRGRAARSAEDEQRVLARLTAIGGALVVVGVVASVVTVLPLLLGTTPFPTAVYLVAMLTPVGLGVLIYGFLRTARARGRRTRAAQRR